MRIQKLGANDQHFKGFEDNMLEMGQAMGDGCHADQKMWPNKSLSTFLSCKTHRWGRRRRGHKERSEKIAPRQAAHAVNFLTDIVTCERQKMFVSKGCWSRAIRNNNR